ncbi:MAG: zinc-ribbon domain-containing protein [Actinomycetota bacterium]|nr:zinc-ribbon domain-containing protein [Actinomycetota bacterium]
MVDKCKQCGKELAPDADSPYCDQCDDMLDKRFDKIEDDIIVYKDLTPEEIDILKKFDKENILESYAKTYTQFANEGQITEKEEILLNEIKNNSGLNQKEIMTKLEFFKKLGKELCPDCHMPIKDDYNLCPYCGYTLNEILNRKQRISPDDSSKPQDAWGQMLKNTGCTTIFALSYWWL